LPFSSPERVVLGQSKVDFALGHRKRGTYAFAHLAPKKYYQYFFLASQVGQLVPLHKGAFMWMDLESAV
jgi:hypothetical protein